MKKFLLLCVAAATAITAGAQTDYHGFNIDASQALIDNQLRGALDKEVYRIGKALTMQVLYQPEYRHTQANADLTAFEYGTTTASVKNKFADLTKADATQTQAALEAGTVDGFLVKATMDANGLAYVTVPEQYYKGGSLVDTPAEGGDFRVRFVMESADKGRINDLDEMHCDDITGVYVTIDAPATVTIENDFVQANTSTKFDGTNATGTTDQLGAMQRTATFPLPSTKGNGPEDITYTSKPTNCYNLFTYKRESDVYAFPICYVDIVFHGVKPGERVGWTNYQTLHEGYTPNEFSGVESIAAEDADAPAVYYNLQGMEVSNPQTGLYIERRGKSVRKIILHN